MAENKGYGYINFYDPRISNLPERIINKRISHNFSDRECCLFRKELSIFDKYFLLEHSRKYYIGDVQYLVINTYNDDTTNPVETLSTYIYNMINYDNHLYHHRNCPQDQACLTSEKPESPESPDVIIVNIENWMHRYIDDEIIEKIRIAYQKKLLSDDAFNKRLMNLLQERREKMINSLFSEEISDDLIALTYRGNKEQTVAQ